MFCSKIGVGVLTDALNTVNTEMEQYYSSLEQMEQKEATVQKEILTKIEEMKKLGDTLRSKRDEALHAIGQMTKFDFKSKTTRD